MSFLDVSRIYGHHTLQICIWFPLELVRALDWLQGNVVRLRLCTDFPEMSYPRESWQLACENRISLALTWRRAQNLLSKVIIITLDAPNFQR